ncbi:hypothetical protein AcV7_006565 [Taiwanofungus camphoratus]|uniref:Immunomodulatory protein n=1 Tax=Taiwanofungus camphoratus TaxID=2696576 RepID=Q6J935_TAICA|nr:immunomodulatory protein [Taiwanofungus camphoratus]KAI0956057.1 hypothetical protein AcV7_006565 [Antrodia cinnamomea]
MKVAVALSALFLLPSALGVNVTYDPFFDNPNNSLSYVACSDGTNGLLTKGYTTLGSLPDFPYIGGAYAIAGWNSPSCGTCWELTYNNVSINILGIDTAAGFNIALTAMNVLTNNAAVDLGEVDAAAIQVDSSVCGL